MQKKKMKYPRFIKLIKADKLLFISIIILLVSGCAYQGEKRFDLRNLNISSQQVPEKTDLMLAAEAGDSGRLKISLP